MGAPSCPTPTKKGYKRWEPAERHRRQVQAKDGEPMKIYWCKCRHWHVAHMTVEESEANDG